jgi:hypothetical protein
MIKFIKKPEGLRQDSPGQTKLHPEHRTKPVLLILNIANVNRLGLTPIPFFPFRIYKL